MGTYRNHCIDYRKSFKFSQCGVPRIEGLVRGQSMARAAASMNCRLFQELQAFFLAPLAKPTWHLKNALQGLLHFRKGATRGVHAERGSDSTSIFMIASQYSRGPKKSFQCRGRCDVRYYLRRRLMIFNLPCHCLWYARRPVQLVMPLSLLRYCCLGTLQRDVHRVRAPKRFHAAVPFTLDGVRLNTSRPQTDYGES